MEFATITPSRNDRPELLEFCRHQLQRMVGVKPSKSYFIIHESQKYPDLIDRIKHGIKRARNDGFEFVFIMEDDDFYPIDYFCKMEPKESDCFVGSPETTYYNLRNNTWQTMAHPGRSSLFNTGFNLNCIKFFDFPQDNKTNLDIELWNFANQKNLSTRFVKNGSVGMKHGLGICGGKGHEWTMKNQDEHWEWLKANVDTEAFTFYKSLKVKNI